jgi:hypothetical protein
MFKQQGIADINRAILQEDSFMIRNNFAKLLCLLALVSVVGTSGCSTRPTMEELEKEAVTTGDWSEVEKRKEMDHRMGKVDPDRQCPPGEALLCRQKGEKEDCECVESNWLRNQN